jgi:hypothetical protein
MHLQIVWQFIDWMSLPLLAVLAGLLLWRGVHRKFPYFLYYIVACELIGLVRLWFYSPVTFTYYYIYWTTDVLIAVFAFLTTYELFVKRLFPKFYSIAFYRYLFPTAALFMTLVAVPAALQTRNAPRLLSTIHVLDILRVSMLLFFVALMVFMGRRWSRYELGIATGLTLQAAAVLITSAVWARSPLVRNALERLPVIMFDIACLVWTVAFLKPEQSTKIPAQLSGPDMLTEAKKWETTLKASLGGKKSRH